MVRARKSLVVPVAMMIVALPTLIGLGVWQWQRLGEKRAQLDRIEARTVAAPQAISVLSLVSSKQPVDQLDYMPVRLSGRFLHESEAHVFTNLADPPAGSFGGPGYDVLTLFAGSGGGLVLVDRGFVPPERRNATTRPDGQIEGATEITGFIRRPERRTYLDAADNPAINYFSIRDPKAIIAAKLSASALAALGPVGDAFYIDQTAPVPKGGLPQPNQLQVNIPNNHLQYALTWWGLALVFAVMFVLFLRGRSREA